MTTGAHGLEGQICLRQRSHRSWWRVWVGYRQSHRCYRSVVIENRPLVDAALSCRQVADCPGPRDDLDCGCWTLQAHSAAHPSLQTPKMVMRLNSKALAMGDGVCVGEWS